MEAGIVAVWAPMAEGLDLLVEGHPDVALAPGADGWFTGPVLGPGTRYHFRVHGGPGDGRTITDPGAHALPDGVHGPAEVVDHAAFAWSDHAWAGPVGPARAVLYELHVGTFTPEGTFAAAAERLVELADLGITHVELLPVNSFTGRRGWGYDGVAWWAPHHAYGGVEGLKRFIDRAHGEGLGVVLDVVYNHLGPEGDTTWCLWPIKNPAHATPWGDAVNLDGEGSAGVRRLLIDNALGWFERYHADGLRLDAVHALVDESPTHVLAELTRAVDDLSHRLGRPLWVTAESDARDANLVTDRSGGGHGVGAVWADDLHHTLHTALTGERSGYYEAYGRPDQVADALRDPYAGRAPGTAEAVGGERFVVCDQNHDQVGNRARGERLAHLVGPDAALAALTLVACSTQVPLLWMGEEWAASSPWPFFADPHDLGLADAIRTGRRAEFAAFGWAPEDVPDPTDPETFQSAVLDWAERDGEPHAGVLAYVRALLGLRRSHPDLGAGDRSAQDVVVLDDQAVVLRRGRLTIVANLGLDAVSVPASGTLVLATPNVRPGPAGPTITGAGAAIIEGPR